MDLEHIYWYKNIMYGKFNGQCVFTRFIVRIIMPIWNTVFLSEPANYKLGI